MDMGTYIDLGEPTLPRMPLKDLAVQVGLHGWLAMKGGLLKRLERRQQAATACIQGLDSVLLASLYPNSVVW